MKLTVKQALDAAGIEPIKQSGNEIYIRCPHCGSPKGKLKCSVNVEKEVYGCFQCGRGGNLADLFIAQTGFTGDRRAAWNEMERIVNGEEFVPKAKTFEIQVPKKAAEAEKASADTLDRTYRTMLSFLELKPEHKEDLLRRTLTQEEIDEGLFASMPLDRIAICKKLQNAHCQLEGVPGFFLNRRKEWELSGRPGYCCPVFQSGKVVGIQIHVDEPVGGCKYVWLSSANRTRGVSSGSPPSFFGDPKSRKVFITEGILKSYIVYQLLDQKASVMGVPGVSAIKEAISLLKTHQHKVAVEAYDMDKRMRVSEYPVFSEKLIEQAYKSGDMEEYYHMSQENADAIAPELNKQKMLKRAENKLLRALKECGLEVRISLWDVDQDGMWSGTYKGLDDFLAAKRE